MNSSVVETQNLPFGGGPVYTNTFSANIGVLGVWVVLLDKSEPHVMVRISWEDVIY